MSTTSYRLSYDDQDNRPPNWAWVRGRIMMRVLTRALSVLALASLMIIFVSCDWTKIGQQAKAPRFLSVSVGFDHACAIRSDQTVVCWGWNGNGQSNPPAGQFRTISAGLGYTCGLTEDENIKCWGELDSSSIIPPDGLFKPEGQFKAVSAGSAHICALRLDDTAECWGSNEFFSGEFVGQATAPSGKFQSVSAGEYYNCGVRLEGTVDCWGDSPVGQTSPSGLKFQSLSAGWGSICGLPTTGGGICWGQRYELGSIRYSSVDDGTPTRPPPAGEFQMVSTGHNGYACAIRVTGGLECWGSPGYYLEHAPDGEFQSISMKLGTACGVRNDGSMVCWDTPDTPGPNAIGRGTPPSGGFRSVAIGKIVCVVHAKGNLACDGWDPQELPQDEFQTIAAYGPHHCGLRTDRILICWGEIFHGASETPKGELRAISLGPDYGCAIRTDATLACWGNDEGPLGKLRGVIVPPSGQYKVVSTGASFACGVREDDTAVCWGGRFGEARIQEGQFSSVQIAGGIACGLRLDLSVLCWASHHSITTEREERSIEALSTGNAAHACGITVDGSVVCWPDDEGRILPAELGHLRSLVVGAPNPRNDVTKACGISSDGGLRCWFLGLSANGLVMPAR